MRRKHRSSQRYQGNRYHVWQMPLLLISRQKKGTNDLRTTRNMGNITSLVMARKRLSQSRSGEKDRSPLICDWWGGWNHQKLLLNLPFSSEISDQKHPLNQSPPSRTSPVVQIPCNAAFPQWVRINNLDQFNINPLRCWSLRAEMASCVPWRIARLVAPSFPPVAPFNRKPPVGLFRHRRCPFPI